MNLIIDDFEKRMLISGLYNDINSLSKAACEESAIVEDFDLMFSTIKSYMDLLEKLIYNSILL